MCRLCRPAGKLKLTVKATWLKDAKVDVDALTELSFGTHRSTEAGDWAEEEGEQVGCVLGSMQRHVPAQHTGGGWTRQGQSTQHKPLRQLSTAACAGFQSSLIAGKQGLRHDSPVLNMSCTGPERV